MIFVNGDSISFGCELSADDMEYIEEHRFSNIIGKKLNKEVVNISNVQRTNDSIARSTIEWIESHRKPEFAIIQFGPDKRFEWYDENEGWIKISPNRVDTKKYFKDKKIRRVPALPAAIAYYRDIDNLHVRQMNMWKNVFLLESYLESEGIPHYFWYGKGNPREENRKLDDLDISYRNLSWWKDMEEMCDIIGTKNDNPENYPVSKTSMVSMNWGAANGIHPNENGHKLLAEHLLAHII
tara:strand:+ start:3860 stop:4576 length:717 start_codon:yes stop_codon:yes gene_type:complete